jgi:hypothetical protein
MAPQGATQAPAAAQPAQPAPVPEEKKKSFWDFDLKPAPPRTTRPGQ